MQQQLAIVSIISAALIGAIVLSLITSSADSTIIEYTDGRGITRAAFEFKGNQILLTLKLARQMTCKQAMSAMSVKPFSIKSRTYVPECITITNDMIVIEYMPKSL